MVQLKVRLFAASLLILMVLAISLPAMALAQTTDWQATPLYHIRTPDASPAAIAGYSPSFIIGAYNLQSTNGGSGTTIAIVDAYNDPNVASDIAAFSAQFSLPAANLVIHKMSSTVASNMNWAVEISLDIEWAHAIAPYANILLVEANSNSLGDLLNAVNYARSQPNVVAVSISWGGSEFSTETSYDSYFTSQYGAIFFASSGDTGGALIWPSSSVNVISVGGTTLTQGASGYTETAWSGSGGGVSAYEPTPAYQSGLDYSNRATPDVSYNANPNTGFAVYDSYGYSGWLVVGGTSCGAPQWAAIQALGKTVTSNTLYTDYNSPTLYAADFRDITTGTAGSNSAGKGYDLVTGIGSPLTTNFAAPANPDFSLSTSPSALTIQAGQTGTTTLTATSLDGYTGTVNLGETDSNGWASFTPSSISVPSPGSATSAVSITVPGATQAGTYTIAVNGADSSGSGPSHTTTITVTVTTPDFSISASPSSITVQSGATGTSTITIAALNGFQNAVTLSATSPPSWTTPTFNTNPIQTSGTSTLTVTVPPGTASGTYTVTVTGTSGTLSHSTTVTVTVTNPDFSISASPSSITVGSGSQGTSRITITALNGFKGTVSLTASTSGGGLTATPSPSQITNSGTSTLTIKVPSTTRSGTFTVTVTGTSGTLSHSATITVRVSRF
jgi:subtilase family serine protease